MTDPFADAFAEMADRAYKESLKETYSRFRHHIRETVAEDDEVPDILIIISGDTAARFQHNGLSQERILWMIEQFRHHLLSGDE